MANHSVHQPRAHRPVATRAVLPGLTLLIALAVTPALQGCSVISWALSSPGTAGDADSSSASEDNKPPTLPDAAPSPPSAEAAAAPQADAPERAPATAAAEASPRGLAQVESAAPIVDPSIPPAQATRPALAAPDIGAEPGRSATARSAQYSVLMRSFRDEISAYQFAADLREKFDITPTLADPERAVNVEISGRHYFVLAGSWTDEATARQRAQRLKRVVGGNPSAYRKPEPPASQAARR